MKQNSPLESSIKNPYVNHQMIVDIIQEVTALICYEKTKWKAHKKKFKNVEKNVRENNEYTLLGSKLNIRIKKNIFASPSSWRLRIPWSLKIKFFFKFLFSI